jgi:serine/threonine protein phosphatase PrpC
MPSDTRNKRLLHKRVLSSSSLGDQLGITFEQRRISRSLASQWGFPLPEKKGKYVPPQSVQADPAPSFSLSKEESLLVKMVLREGGRCTAEDITRFIRMHPGERELRMLNAISATWDMPDWHEQRQRMILARESLYEKLGIEGPTDGQKMEAVLRPEALTDDQRSLVAAIAESSNGHVSAADVESFRKVLLRKTPEEAAAAWRKDALDLMTIASLGHKMRFVDSPTFDLSELKLLTMLRGLMGARSITISDAEFGSLRSSLEEMTPHMTVDGEFIGYRVYAPQIFALWLLNSRFMRFPSLKTAARVEEEFHTIAGFAGLSLPKAEGRIDYSFGSSVPKTRENGADAANDDAFSSAIVSLSDGRTVRFDAVWDGMGGYEGGAVASGIAKEIFEISAVAGWLKHPEDMRRISMMADFAIVFAQIGSNLDPADKRLHDPRTFGHHRKNNQMGTTAVISMQSGEDLYVFNCGDSDFRLFIDGKNAYRHVYHDSSYEFRLKSKEPQARKLVTEELERTGADLSVLDRGRREKLDRKVLYFSEKLLLNDPDMPISSTISSALGGLSNYMQINGTTFDYEPLKVKGSSILKLSSDGESDTVCPHEENSIIYSSGGDMKVARKKMLDLACSRSAEGDPIKLPCGCSRLRKNDDKTLILRKASDGLE